MTLLSNRYRLIRELGVGGFGKTFPAEDMHLPSRRCCVIKQLKPITNNPQIYQLIQERFEREAAILEELGGKSDQIPKLYGYFPEVGQFYLVQELIEGQTLSHKVQHEGLLSESLVKEILENILPVLDYVHSRRIVHRDIKPDNIILRDWDSKPVLIDFGAVRESMATVVSQINNTKSIVIGTPGFMPSEQASGRPVYASDLYSLGLTAIYLLTGKLPQQLETEPQTGEIIWQQYAVDVSSHLRTVPESSDSVSGRAIATLVLKRC
jgi:serine/threonine-protein kinase